MSGAHPQPTSKALAESFARLYAAPLADFVALRKRIATDLKKSGDPESAARISDARKPTATAWAVNQIAHRHPDALGEFTAAIAALRTAQKDLLEAPLAKVAEAKARFRSERSALNERVAALVKLARAALESDGGAWNLTTQKRITATLHVLPLASAEDRSKFLEGRLEKDLDASSDDGAIESAFGPVDERALGARHRERAEERAVAKTPPSRSTTAAAVGAEARPARSTSTTSEKSATQRLAERESARKEAEIARREQARRDAELRAKKRDLEHRADDADREAKRLDAEATKAEAAATRARGDADRAKVRAKEARDRLATLRPT